MGQFSTLPPSQVRPIPGGYIAGGLMQTGEPDFTALILFDVRSLGLTAAQGQALAAAVREFAQARLAGMDVDLRNRGAVDLSASVFGIAFD